MSHERLLESRAVVPSYQLLNRRSCSSADVNPIGGISKTDLKRFIAWAETEFDMPILRRCVTRGLDTQRPALLRSVRWGSGGCCRVSPRVVLTPMQFPRRHSIGRTHPYRSGQRRPIRRSRDGHDVRRALGLWAAQKGRKVRAVQHVWEARAGVGEHVVPNRGERGAGRGKRKQTEWQRVAAGGSGWQRVAVLTSPDRRKGQAFLLHVCDQQAQDVSGLSALAMLPPDLHLPQPALIGAGPP
jgi:hypothetical protein